MVNCDPATGIRYGTIYVSKLDPDVAEELWHGPGAVDVSWQEALRELEREIEREADTLEEAWTLNCRDEDERLAAVEAGYERNGYDGREDYYERRFEQERDHIQIDEPRIEGEYEGVKYAISWLGGAPLLWVFEGPQGYCRSLCSPCVPGAGDLDSGYYMEGEPFDPVEEWGHTGHECYCVPRSWLQKEES